MKIMNFVALAFLLYVGSANAINNILVLPIISDNLSAERELFIKFQKSGFDGIGIAKEAGQFFFAMDLEAFNKDCDDYNAHSENVYFFNAIFDNKLVGYISFEVQENRAVNIRQIAIDPEMYDDSLVKELLFALFQDIPQVRYITCALRTPHKEVMSVFYELGFSLVGDQFPFVFELVVSNKCKICEVLYGVDFWNDGDAEGGDWDTEAETAHKNHIKEDRAYVRPLE